MTPRTRLQAQRALLVVDVSMIVLVVAVFAFDHDLIVLLPGVAGVLTGLSLVWDRPQRRRIFGLEPTEDSDRT